MNPTNQLLRRAYNNFDYNTIRSFIEQKPDDVNDLNNKTNWINGLVWDTVTRGKLDALIFLIHQYKPDLHYCNELLLYDAVRHGRINIVKYLVEEQGADIHDHTPRQRSALYCASHYGHIEITRYLKTHYISQFTKRHIDKQNIRYASEQHKLPFEIQQLISSYV